MKISSLLKKQLHLLRICKSTNNQQASSRINILCDQFIDSSIVAGITGISAYVAGGEVASVNSAIIAFLLTFLIKMKEYRNID